MSKLTHHQLRVKFVSHLRTNVHMALALLAVSLLIGMTGYHRLAPMGWVDAFLNAAMLLGGMGPADPPLTNNAAKLFAGAYALYCGLVLIVISGLIIGPVAAHIVHRFHLDQDQG